ncbi:MAG TPA: EAL domain-containing protein [Sideroxyarcus sp.]|nr:EAL domain-containing protein [Sideroxyarcus sp.]
MIQSDWVRGSLLALAYFVFAQIGLSLAVLEHSVTVFWPPSGIALAFLLLYGYRYWPAVFIGSLCANLVSSLPLYAVLGMATGSTLEALLAAYLLNRHARFKVDLTEARDVFRLAWRAGVLSTLLAAVIGSLSLRWAGAIHWDDFSQTMLFWWMGDALGIVLFTPVVISLIRHKTLIWNEVSRYQIALLFVALSLLWVLVFTRFGVELLEHQPGVFLLMPVLIWAALNFNSRILGVVLLSIAGGALFSANSGQGYFAGHNLSNIFELWLYLVVTSMVAVTISAASFQRNRAKILIERSERNLKRSQHVAKLGTWRLDIPKNKLEWSEETYSMLGVDRNTPLTLEVFFSCIHPDDREAVGAAWQAALRGAPYDIEHRVLVNGRVKWVREQAELDFSAKGTPLTGIGTVLDITRHKQAEQALRDSQKSQQAIIDTALDAVIQMNEDGLITGWNKQAEKTFGWSLPEALGMPLHELIIPPEKRDLHVRGLQRVMSGGDERMLNSRNEVEAVHRDGHRLQIELAVTRIRFNGRTEFSAFIRDISQRKQEEEQLRLAAKVFQGTNEAILISDADNRIVTVNDAFIRTMGYSIDEIKGCNPNMFSSGNHDDNFYEGMWRSLNENGHWQGEIVDRDKHGRLVYKQMTINAVKNQQGVVTNYVAIASDISERKEYDKNVHFLAYYDVLTGLPNRTLLRDRIGQMIATSHRDRQSFALLFLDLDRFKYINDSMGHSVGDRLLQSVAQRLQGCVREGDTVSRIGGDEFIVLLREIDEQGVTLVAEKLLKALATPYDLGGQIISTYASIGIALYPEHATDIDVLMKNADAAMYRAKEDGRNNFKFFTPEMHFRANQIFSMEKDLRVALEQDQFTLVYQPQVELATGRICGVESLIRWKHPEKGFVSPAEFIPIAEETGQIVAIGEWVLNAACWRMANWQKQGMPEFPVSVNLSIRQLRQPNLGDVVARVLKQSGLKPECLELEITEGIMMADTKAAMDFLNRMRDMGVQMSIDDFGTGFSSLSYLKNLPVNKLKIDQSFVRDIETDESDAAIVRSVISLGHRLDMKVIAEGVETQEQLDFLRIRGCDEIQGYFFSRPLTADDFLKFVQSEPRLN